MTKLSKNAEMQQSCETAVMRSAFCPKDLMIGNFINRKYYNPHPSNPSWELEKCEVVGIRKNSVIVKIKGGSHSNLDYWEAIKITEQMLESLGFSVINENSAGKRYGYVIDGIFSSDLTFTFWKTTKEAGKFFRGDLELKSVHQLQNLYFALTEKVLVISDAFLQADA